MKYVVEVAPRSHIKNYDIVLQKIATFENVDNDITLIEEFCGWLEEKRDVIAVYSKDAPANNERHGKE